MRETEILRGLTKAKQNCFQTGMVPSRLDELRARAAAEKDPRRKASIESGIRDAELEEAEAAKRAPVPAKTPAATPVQTLPAPQPTMPVQPVAAPQTTLQGAAKELQGRSAENMGKKYGFERGTPFVEAPRGVSKDGDHVPAMLEHGEAVLPKATVAAVGAKSIQRLIEETTGRSPKQGLRGGLRAQVGAVPSWLEPVERAWNDTDMAKVSRMAMDDARNSDNLATAAGHVVRGALATVPAALADAKRGYAELSKPLQNFATTVVTPAAATPAAADPNELPVYNPRAASSSQARFTQSMGPAQAVWAGKFAAEHGAPVAVRDTGHGGITQTTLRDGRKVFSNLNSVGEERAYNAPYVAADGTPTSDWTKTRAYAEGVKRAEKDKLDAAMLDAAEGARTQSGAAGEREKQAALGRMRVGLEAARLKNGLSANDLLTHEREMLRIGQAQSAAKAKAQAESRKDAQKDYEEFFKTTGYNEQETVGFRDFLNANYSYTGQDGKKKSFADMSWEERRKAMPKMKDEYQLMKQAQARALGEGTTLGAFEPKEIRNMTMEDVSPGEVAGLKMGVKLFNFDNDPKQMSVAEYLGRKVLPDSVVGSDEVVVGKNGEVMRKADYLNAPGPYGSKDRRQTLRDALGK